MAHVKEQRAQMTNRLLVDWAKECICELEDPEN